jgi:molybdopterin-guanine dinucleotide biosynthesis protein A
MSASGVLPILVYLKVKRSFLLPLNAAVPCWANGRMELLDGVYRSTSTAKEAEALIGQGDYSVISLIMPSTNVRHVAIDQLRKLDPDTFANIISRDDLIIIISKLKAKAGTC